MVVFPNCKINIGLDVCTKRDDGFHELSTLMYPVHGLCDSLEIVSNQKSGVEFTCSGLTVDCPVQDNICVRAYELIHSRFDIPGIRMHLHKVIPFGAGLGGGSADAAFTIRALASLFNLALNDVQMESLAAELGSDTAFFIQNRAAMASGRGEILAPHQTTLAGKHLVIVKPPFSVSTAQAYGGITPHMPTLDLNRRLTADISTWKQTITNDFENNVFSLYPQLAQLKEYLYYIGAIYASMSGSGSAIYGIFDKKPILKSFTSDTFAYQEVMF